MSLDSATERLFVWNAAVESWLSQGLMKSRQHLRRSERNRLQRSFTDLSISEKAAVLAGKKAEENLLAMRQEVYEKNRQLLKLEVLISVPAIIAGVILAAVAAFFIYELIFLTN